jgi:transcriptional regulator with XRE-family HTH domain
MSTRLYKKEYLSCELFDIHFVMSKEHVTLADFIRQIMLEKNLTFRDVARKGGAISHTTVSDLTKGYRTNIETGTIAALAKGLDIPPEQLERVSRGLSPIPQNRFEIYAETFDGHDLTAKDWEEIESRIRFDVEIKKKAIAEQNKNL